MKVRRKKMVFAAVLLFVGMGTVLVEQCSPKNKAAGIVDTNNYVGDPSCKNCHKSQYLDWLSSDHFKAMQVACDSTVLGDFANRILTADGITSRFFKKSGKYFINTQGEDGAYHDYEIKYTFGHFPLQQYLVVFPGGRMQVARQSWDSKSKKWFHQYAGQTIPPHDWLHWTGNAQNWNAMCARCHSTNLQKNYEFTTDSYHTTYSALTVSCESCHGPGKRHLDYIASTEYKEGKKVRGSFLLMPKNAGQTTQINTCAPCHMRAEEINGFNTSGEELLDNYIPEIPSTEYFYADGQAKDEDYTYGSFLQSKMYSRGVRCTNCHNPHSGRILFSGNQLCLQCHAKKYDDYSHSFHAVGTLASQCISCHMPGTYYMGNDFRHDHALRVPRPDLSVKYGTPNACNKCHTDRPASWAASAVRKWYGPIRAYHFSEDLIEASKANATSERHIVRLINDTATPAIIKATALHYLKDIPTQGSLGLLLKGLSHPDAQVRYRALRSLANFPSETWLSAAASLLSDKVRAVRIAAADLFITVPSTQIPAEYYTAYTSAKTELEKYVLHQSDFASGNVMAGDYYLKLQDYTNAERFYLRSLKKDTALNYARLNLSVVYNLSGKNQEALKVLQQALKTDPKNDRIYFNLALLYNEMHNKAKAKECLASAVALHSQNPRVYYNYGLMLQMEGRLKEALVQLEKAVQLSPRDGDLNYALCLGYLQSGQKGKARQVASVLKQYYAGNSEYDKVIQQLGL